MFHSKYTLSPLFSIVLRFRSDLYLKDIHESIFGSALPLPLPALQPPASPLKGVNSPQPKSRENNELLTNRQPFVKRTTSGTLASVSGGGSVLIPSPSQETNVTNVEVSSSPSRAHRDDTDIATWIGYVASQSDSYRRAGQVSLPVLGKDSAHAALWGNKLVTGSDSSSLDLASNEKFGVGRRDRHSRKYVNERLSRL